MRAIRSSGERISMQIKGASEKCLPSAPVLHRRIYVRNAKSRRKNLNSLLREDERIPLALAVSQERDKTPVEQCYAHALPYSFRPPRHRRNRSRNDTS